MTQRTGIMRSLRAFATDTRGNVIAIGAASILPMLAIVGGTDVITFKNHTEIQLVGRGMGISGRWRPLTAMKCSNCC